VKTVICAAVLAAAATAARAEPAKCQLQAIGELPASATGPDVTTDAEIDGQPVKLTIDTGSDATMLFRDSAARLGLKFRSLDNGESYGVGGASRLYSVRVKELRVGSMEEHDSDLVATGHSNGASQGALGERFLTQADVEFDLPHGKVRFFKPRGCDGDQVVYWGDAYAVAPLEPTPHYQLLVKVSVNGHPLTAQLDTGAAVSVLTPQAAARVGVSTATATRAGKLVGSGHEKITAYVDVFDSFSFGDETIHTAKLWIADLFYADVEAGTATTLLPKRATDEPDMLLGADFFKSHRVYVSLQQKKVYVTYAGGPVFDTTARPQAPQTVTEGPNPVDAPN
jgi:predicted aspartyl protease